MFRGSSLRITWELTGMGSTTVWRWRMTSKRILKCWSVTTMIKLKTYAPFITLRATTKDIWPSRTKSPLLSTMVNPTSNKSLQPSTMKIITSFKRFQLKVSSLPQLNFNPLLKVSSRQTYWSGPSKPKLSKSPIMNRNPTECFTKLVKSWAKPRT